MTKTPDFTLGIEEEYLLVDAKTGELAELPDALMERCKSELEDRVSPEFLRCQIEIGTPVCKDIKEAREELIKLRRRVAEIADDFGLAPIAASCHPFADWRNQLHTDKDRYNALSRDLAAVVRRMLVGGMHVHVGIEDKSQRIDLMNQLSYFLPHFLAISTSSPFWQGEDTGLASYRLTVFGNMPRTGLPPLMHSWAEFERSVGVLSDLDVIEDASKIWWDLRPSVAYPTLETRICDVCPNIERALSIAALIQGTLRMLWRLSKHNIRWRQYDNFLLGENRWRALRYGTSEGLIDFGAGRIEPFKELAEEWVGLLKEDGEALNSTEELEALHGFVADGTSSERQRTVFSGAMSAGATRHEAHRAVVMDLIEEYHRGL